jgi:hypothetical protein
MLSNLQSIKVGGARFLPVTFGVPDRRTTWRVGDLAAQHLLMLKHSLKVLELGVIFHLFVDVVILVEERKFVVPMSRWQEVRRKRVKPFLADRTVPTIRMVNHKLHQWLTGTCHTNKHGPTLKSFDTFVSNSSP